MEMNLQIVPHRNPTRNFIPPTSSSFFNSRIPRTHNTKPLLSFPIFTSVFHCTAKGATDSLKTLRNTTSGFSSFDDFSHLYLRRTKLASISVVNFGFCNAGKTLSERCARFRNGGVFVRLRYGELEEGEDDGRYMRRAVELARKAIGCTSPNPMVGCVIVKDGKIVGEGFHPKAGQPHAEVFALRNAREFAENATAYVSLEPCNHYGRTPPCTEAMIKGKVKKVVIGMVDPNPIVASKGINRLREAGIEVIVGVEEDLCKKLNEAYIHKMLTGKPFVTLRYSISMDGLVLDQMGGAATEPGGYYSQLLQEYDAVVHSSTAPAKESREPNARQPLHVLVAKNPACPISILDSATESARQAIIFTNKEVSVESEAAEKSIETVVTDTISLNSILEYCTAQGSCSVLLDFRGKFNDLEEILKDAFEKNIMQKIMVEVLPLMAGGKGGVPLPFMSLNGLVLKTLSSRMSGKSVLLEGYF